MIDFLTSKTGLFAALVAVVGLAGSLWKLWTDSRDRQGKDAEKKAAMERAARGLAIADPVLSDLSRSSNAYDLQFVVTNTGTKQLIMRTLRLHITDRRAPGAPVASYTMAPLTVHKHRVSIVPERSVYDIRERLFSKEGNEPLAFDPGHAEAFVVKLVSVETMRYTFHVEAEWYAAADPDKTGKVRTPSHVAEFPERVNAGPLTMSPSRPVGN